MSKIKKYVKFNGRQYYSEAFKKMVVREVSRGLLSKEAIKHKYQIKGSSAVLTWCRKYGKLSLFREQDYRMSDKHIPELVLKARIKELERDLCDEKLKTSYLNCLIDIAEEDMGLAIRKKSGYKPSNDVIKKSKDEQ